MRNMMVRAASSQLLGKLNLHAHACRERLPRNPHAGRRVVQGAVGGVQYAALQPLCLKFCI